ncbi:hypothetical protein K469DRAFT_690068 [Zopfia rhizophila CBS 207.26]|uniref:Uncharacterized protein n=1 Tax=Zopfia rhizophila CBS 207.26 TaxID=1314779 RepID=A0A6A6DW83_9PEZI|nr:hypothetical protein K469DRAFT_690068 [Zopfia rhizophila CBS 207.26]
MRHSSRFLALFCALPFTHDQETIELTTGCTPCFSTGVPEFPKVFIQNNNPTVPFEYTNFSNFGQCQPIPDFFTPGTTAMGAFAAFANTSPQIGFIPTARIIMHNNLRNINFAVGNAVDELRDSVFIEDIVFDATAEPLPIKKLAGKALDFAKPEGIEENHQNQPRTLRALLDQVTPWVQNNMRQQNDIFLEEHATGDTMI